MSFPRGKKVKDQLTCCPSTDRRLVRPCGRGPCRCHSDFVRIWGNAVFTPEHRSKYPALDAGMLCNWEQSEGDAERTVRGMKSSEMASLAPRTPQSVDVPAEYRSLHKYLDGRYADTVVLRFAEIEDLLGFALPEHARLEQGWWANADADGEPSPQSRSWIHASRTAVANLVAQSVVFEREVH